MVKRTTTNYIKNILEKNSDWNVIDIASSNCGWHYANIFTDITDYSEFYHRKYGGTKKFIQMNCEEKFPFEDNEFDFVIASHVLEHVHDPIHFCKELCRIGKRGYIEVPTPFWDNLTEGPYDLANNPLGHKSWVTFDDEYNKIVFNKKLEIFKKVLSTREYQSLVIFFSNSALVKLYWENNIECELGNNRYEYNNNRDVDLKFDANLYRVDPRILGSWS